MGKNELPKKDEKTLWRVAEIGKGMSKSAKIL